MNLENKLEDIKEYVNNHLGIDLLSKNRTQPFVRGRYLFTMICRKELIMPPKIYGFLDIDHCTVIHYERFYKQGIYENKNNEIIEDYGKHA
jgi:chromosomal replication initiation ATPase DnaA